MSEDRGHSGASLLLAFLAGAVAGAAVAWLTAPKTGRDLRDSVRSWARGTRGREAAERVARSVRDAFDEAVDR